MKSLSVSRTHCHPKVQARLLSRGTTIGLGEWDRGARLSGSTGHCNLILSAIMHVGFRLDAGLFKVRAESGSVCPTRLNRPLTRPFCTMNVREQ
jgi:hypothetical protein